MRRSDWKKVEERRVEPIIGSNDLLDENKYWLVKFYLRVEMKSFPV
jgi:hypothetical protein